MWSFSAPLAANPVFIGQGDLGDYSHTWTSLKLSGHIDVDSGRGGLYATWYDHGIYLNGAIYGHNNYDSNAVTGGVRINF
jgi:Autotransporter beta-domain